MELWDSVLMVSDEARERLNRDGRSISRKPRHWDREGKPIGLGDWCVLHERGLEYSRIAETDLDLVWVSTVWIGLDYSFGGKPLIFETMVFEKDEAKDEDIDLSGLDVWRWPSEEKARAGHEEVVAEMRAMIESLPGHAHTES